MKHTYRIAPFGGLDRSRPEHEVALNATPDCSGVWSRYGRITRIHGKAKHVDQQLAGDAVMQVFTWVDGAQNEFELAITNARAYKKEGHAYNSIQGGLTDFTGTVDQPIATAGHFDSAGSEICVISNIVDGMRKWTGAGNIADLGGDPPNAEILLPYKGWLLAGIVNESGSINYRKVRYSALFNGESWPTENYFYLKTSTDKLIGMNGMRDRAVIYKKASISLLDYVGGGLVFDLTENYVNGIGPASAAAVVEWGRESERHFFIGQDTKIYEFDGIDHHHISRRIDPILESINPARKNRISGVAIPELSKIIWAMPYSSETECKTLIIYDPLERSWWIKRNENMDISCMGKSSVTTSVTWDTLPYSSWEEWSGTWDDIDESANAPITLIGHTDGYVRKLIDGVDDDGTALPSYYMWPFDNLDGSDETLKLISRVYIEVKSRGSGTISIEIFRDNNADDPVAQNEDGDLSQTVNLFDADDASRGYVVMPVDVVIEGYNFAVRFSRADGAWSAKLRGFDYEVIGDVIV